MTFLKNNILPKKSWLKTLAISAIALGSVSFTTPSIAQTEAPAEPYCKTSPHYSDFDFWIGEWEVSDFNTGEMGGTNKIVSTDNHCFLYESWTDLQGGTGHSMNYYNPLTDMWRQVWVSAGAYVIDIEGGLVDGSMTLVGEIFYAKPNKKAKFRGIWTPQEDGSVRQHFQQFNEEKGEWAEWFDGRYVRINTDK